MAIRLTHRMQQGEIVEVLKRNMSPGLRKALLRDTIETVDDLLRLCGQYERMCREDEKIAVRRRQGRVSEIVNEEQWNRSAYQKNISNFCDETPLQIESMRVSDANRSELAICWNFKEMGHLNSQCPQNQCSVFCFKCGMDGVITVTCPRCIGNTRRDQQARPAIPSPQVMKQYPPPPIPSNQPTVMQRTTPLIPSYPQNLFKQQAPGNSTSH